MTLWRAEYRKVCLWAGRILCVQINFRDSTFPPFPSGCPAPRKGRDGAGQCQSTEGKSQWITADGAGIKSFWTLNSNRGTARLSGTATGGRGWIIAGVVLLFKVSNYGLGVGRGAYSPLCSVISISGSIRRSKQSLMNLSTLSYI
jgi:hypothetical protein